MTVAPAPTSSPTSSADHRLAAQHLVDGATALQPAETLEGGGADQDAEMRPPALAPAAVAAMLLALVEYLETGRGEGVGELSLDHFRAHRHVAPADPNGLGPRR